MASFGQINQIEERTFDKTLYMGMVSANIIAICPNRKQIAAIYGTTEDKVKEPSYISECEGFNSKGEKIKTVKVKIELWVKFVTPDGKEIIRKISNPVSNAVFPSFKDGGFKIQVIDKYGNTAWTTPDNAAKKGEIIGLKKDGSGNYKANIDKDYRPAYKGEADLIDNLRNWWGLKLPYEWDANKNIVWHTGDELKAAECSLALTDWQKIFKGDFSILQGQVSKASACQLKIFVGINEYQGVTNMKVYSRTLRNDDYVRENMHLELIDDKYGKYYSSHEVRTLGLDNNQNPVYQDIVTGKTVPNKFVVMNQTKGVAEYRFIESLHLYDDGIKPSEQPASNPASQAVPAQPTSQPQPETAAVPTEGAAENTNNDDLPF